MTDEGRERQARLLSRAAEYLESAAATEAKYRKSLDQHPGAEEPKDSRAKQFACEAGAKALREMVRTILFEEKV